MGNQPLPQQKSSSPSTPSEPDTVKQSTGVAEPVGSGRNNVTTRPYTNSADVFDSRAETLIECGNQPLPQQKSSSPSTPSEPDAVTQSTGVAEPVGSDRNNVIPCPKTNSADES